MSQLKDIVDAVKELKDQQKLSIEVASDHLYRLLLGLEWDISEREPERWLYYQEPSEYWQQKEEIAKQSARKLLEDL